MPSSPVLSAASRGELIERQRLGGPEALDDAEILQLASGASAAAVASLLAESGSLPQVLAADAAALGRCVSHAQAGRLALARDLSRRILQAPLKARPVLSDASAASDYLRSLLSGRPREEFHVLFLDRRNRLFRDETMGRGSVDHAPVYPREVVRRALEFAASAVLLAHNHPSGDPNPSPADVAVTQEIAAAGRALRIALHDHLLVAGERVVSFRSLGLL